MLHTDTVAPATLALLRQLMQVPELADFLLVDGTNLSLRYGHRLSVDLDLFTNQSFYRDDVYEGIRKALPQTILLDQRKQTIWLTINGVKVDVILHEYPYLQGLDEIDGIRLLAVDDIIPMKLEAMATRGVKKDFWDVAELLDHFTIGQMLNFYERKYANNDPGHILRSMTYFVDADVEKVNPQSLKGQTWPAIKDKLRKAVSDFVKGQL